MSITYRLRSFLAKLVLRGWIRELWLRRKARLLERRYLQSLAQTQGPIPSPAEAMPLLKLPAAPLRRVLFIADCYWEDQYLTPELQKICHVTTLDLHPRLGAKLRAPDPDQLLRVLREFGATKDSSDQDLILLYARPNILSEEAFAILRQHWKCPLLGMNLDDKVEFLDYGLFSEGNDNYQRWARFFDLNLTNSRAAIDWYSDRQLPVYYMPQGFHLTQAPPPSVVPSYQFEISFLGLWRPERGALIQSLRNVGLPVHAFGAGWPNSVFEKEPEQIYRHSMINLGIGLASPARNLTTIKGRDFECPGAGACYLTTYNWELALHYEIGKEILCYRSVEELIELLSFYRRRPAACLQMAQAAYRRCADEHTWEKRFRALFGEMGFRLD